MAQASQRQRIAIKASDGAPRAKRNQANQKAMLESIYFLWHWCESCSILRSERVLLVLEPEQIFLPSCSWQGLDQTKARREKLFHLLEWSLLLKSQEINHWTQFVRWLMRDFLHTKHFYVRLVYGSNE